MQNPTIKVGVEHLEIYIERTKSEYDVECNYIGNVIGIYKETITQKTPNLNNLHLKETITIQDYTVS